MTVSDWDQAAPASAEDLGLTRRGQLTAMIAAFAGYVLAAELAAARPGRRMAARDWIDRQDEIARALKRGTLSPRAWMDAVVGLAGEIDVAELMASLDQARVTAAAMPPTNDPQKRHVRFLDADGAPRKLAYGAALFDFAPHNVITPHGHRHMASAHLVVAGAFRVRNFDRVRDEPGAMVIRPTRDFRARTGTLSTMSPDRDNIHWFVPDGGPARTFDLVISGLDAGAPDYEIQAIDPLGGRRLADGTIRAPIMSFEAASARYTAKM